MSRPGRPGQSCACGALIKATNEIKSEGLTCNCKIPGGEPWADCMLAHLDAPCLLLCGSLTHSRVISCSHSYPTLHLQCTMLWTLR